MAHLSSDPAVLQTLNPNFVGWEQTIPFGSKYLSKSRKTWWSSSMFFKKLRSKVFLRCSPGHWVTLWGTKSTVTGYDKASKRSKHLKVTRRQDASACFLPSNHILVKLSPNNSQQNQCIAGHIRKAVSEAVISNEDEILVEKWAGPLTSKSHL